MSNPNGTYHQGQPLTNRFSKTTDSANKSVFPFLWGEGIMGGGGIFSPT